MQVLNDTVGGPSLQPQAGDRVMHYKGGFYSVLRLARDEATCKLVVIYFSDEDNAWTRTMKSWRTPAGSWWQRAKRAWRREPPVPRFVLISRLIEIEDL